MSSFNSIKEATKLWRDEFNAIPTKAVIALSECDPHNFEVLAVRDYDLANYCLFNNYAVPFPLFGTMWCFPNFDMEWAENNIKTIANCGFDVYNCDLLGGFVIGVNGCGYDFLSHHWAPLYEARYSNIK